MVTTDITAKKLLHSKSHTTGIIHNLTLNKDQILSSVLLKVYVIHYIK